MKLLIMKGSRLNQDEHDDGEDERDDFGLFDTVLGESGGGGGGDSNRIS